MQLELEFLHNPNRKYIYKITLDADHLKPRHIFLKKMIFSFSYAQPKIDFTAYFYDYLLKQSGLLSCLKKRIDFFLLSC